MTILEYRTPSSRLLNSFPHDLHDTYMFYVHHTTIISITISSIDRFNGLRRRIYRNFFRPVYLSQVVVFKENSSVGSKESPDLSSHSYPSSELTAIHFQLAA
jgi:hypothetical protein